MSSEDLKLEEVGKESKESKKELQKSIWEKIKSNYSNEVYSEEDETEEE